MDIETHRELLNEIASLKRRCDALEAAMARVLQAVPSAASAADLAHEQVLLRQAADMLASIGTRTIDMPATAPSAAPTPAATISPAPVAQPVSYDVAPSEPLQFHDTTSTAVTAPDRAAVRLSKAQWTALEDVSDCKVARHWMADRYNVRTNLRPPHKFHYAKVTVHKLITLGLVHESEKIGDWHNVSITDLGRAALSR